MKKFLTIIVLTIFSFWISIQSFAADSTNYYPKQVTIYQVELNKTNKWKQYLKVADVVVEKYKNDRKTLDNLQSRLAGLDTSSLNDKDLINMLNYLEAKVNISLTSLQDSKLNEVLTPTISATDKKLVDDQIIAIQKSLVKKWEALITNAISQLEKSLNKKETWDLKINFELNEDNIWEIKANVDFNNYEAITNGFDSQLKSDLNVFMQILESGKDEVKLEASSYLDLISKEWTMYFLLKNFRIISEENTDEFKEILTKIEEFATKNQYIKSEDKNSQLMFNAFKSINYKNTIADIEKASATPMFEAYKKDWSSYYLRPTKYLCDYFKISVLWWASTNSCSDKEYTSMLQDFAEIWTISFSTINGVTTIWFNWITDSYTLENLWYITLTNGNIIGSGYSYKDTDGSMVALNYLNQKITWSLTLVDEVYDSYDDVNKKYIYTKNIITSTIEWTTLNGKLNDLKIVYKWTNEKTWEYLNWAFNISGKTFSFMNNYNTDTNKSIINISWNSDNDGILDNLDINITYDEKTWHYNYNTWEYVYDEDFSKVLDSKISVKNKIISWISNFYSEWKIMATITNNWSYTKETFKLDNKLELSDEISDLMNLMFYWDSKVHKITWNLNILTDKLNNKNDAYILFNILDNWETIIKYEIDSKGQVQSGNIPTIEAPINTVDLEDVLGLDEYELSPYFY